MATQARKGKGGCPFLTATAKSAAAFREGLLAAPRDVEELAASGRRRAVCPYYAARRAAAEADLLLVPYGSLLTQVLDTWGCGCLGLQSVCAQDGSV